MPILRQLKRSLLELSPKEALFSRRGFPACHSHGREHLERVFRTFIEGYNLALFAPSPLELALQLDSTFESPFVGFAYEGAGLRFALSDLLLPGSKSRLRAFIQSVAPHHDFIATIGAGFAIARAPLGVNRLKSYQRRLDPMSAWCLADGYGFHQGIFHWKRFVVERQPAPRSFGVQDRRLFDAGVGRSMWWVFGADPERIASEISGFDSDRRPEMWTGIGTALAYAGGVSPETSSLLLDLAGDYGRDLLSGIFFAAHMRHKGGNSADWTEGVCSHLLGLSVAETSARILSDLNVFFDSWTGSEEDKWSNCYLALRSSIKRRLENYEFQPSHSSVMAKAAL